MKKSIGIIGGMGPLATADLFTKIVKMTDADCDNDHIRIYIDNNVQITDRTAAILHGGENPLPYMTESAKKLQVIGADCIIMPCNTAHYYLPQLQQTVDIPFISIIHQAVKVSKQRYPDETVGILATNGTLDAKVYSDVYTAQGVKVVEPTEEERKILMDIIYNRVKAGRIPTDPTDFQTVLDGMKARGADYFVLGCTELPVAVQSLGLREKFVDATAELAKAAIEFCGYKTRE